MSDEYLDSFVEGRYPHEFTRLDPKNMTVGVSVYDNEAVFRVDDKANLDFWLQVSVSKEQLKEILRKMEEGGK